jgi:hypothetical protein
MGEQLTFFPYWTRTFGEFEICAWAVHSAAPVTSWGGGIIFEHRIEAIPAIERNYYDPA